MGITSLLLGPEVIPRAVMELSQRDSQTWGFGSKSLFCIMLVLDIFYTALSLIALKEPYRSPPHRVANVTVGIVTSKLPNQSKMKQLSGSGLLLFNPCISLLHYNRWYLMLLSIVSCKPWRGLRNFGKAKRQQDFRWSTSPCCHRNPFKICVPTQMQLIVSFIEWWYT